MDTDGASFRFVFIVASTLDITRVELCFFGCSYWLKAAALEKLLTELRVDLYLLFMPEFVKIAISENMFILTRYKGFALEPFGKRIL